MTLAQAQEAVLVAQNAVATEQAAVNALSQPVSGGTMAQAQQRLLRLSTAQTNLALAINKLAAANLQLSTLQGH